jgi:beta-glucosidase
MPWFNEVESVLLTYFGGQQMGNALADVIYGAVNPGARTTTTWAVKMSDVPVINTTPTNGELHYTEGRFIGYRAWRRANRTPQIPFGHGLSYTTFSSELLAATREGAKVRVTNTGARAGSQVIQIYATNDTSDAFERRLVGFSKVSLQPGESREVDISLEPLGFKRYQGGWQDIAGRWKITLAENAFDGGQTLLV